MYILAGAEIVGYTRDPVLPDPAAAAAAAAALVAAVPAGGASTGGVLVLSPLVPFNPLR